MSGHKVADNLNPRHHKQRLSSDYVRINTNSLSWSLGQSSTTLYPSAGVMV